MLSKAKRKRKKSKEEQHHKHVKNNPVFRVKVLKGVFLIVTQGQIVTSVMMYL